MINGGAINGYAINADVGGIKLLAAESFGASVDVVWDRAVLLEDGLTGAVAFDYDIASVLTEGFTLSDASIGSMEAVYTATATLGLSEATAIARPTTSPDPN